MWLKLPNILRFVNTSSLVASPFISIVVKLVGKTFFTFGGITDASSSTPNKRLKPAVPGEDAWIHNLNACYFSISADKIDDEVDNKMPTHQNNALEYKAEFIGENTSVLDEDLKAILDNNDPSAVSPTLIDMSPHMTPSSNEHHAIILADIVESNLYVKASYPRDHKFKYNPSPKPCKVNVHLNNLFVVILRI